MAEAPAYLTVGKRRIRLPRSRALRIALAIGLLIRGILPPPHGLILIPAAMALLSRDIPMIRRWRRIIIVRAGRRRKAAKSERV